MAFALIKNGSVLEYPYTPNEQGFFDYQDYPSVGVYWVWPTPEPEEFDSATQKTVEATPVYNGIERHWEQVWEVVPKTAEELRLEKYDPSGFLQAMFTNENFETWLSSFSPFKQSGFMNAATNAKVDQDWSVVQALYTQLTLANQPSFSSKEEWQSVADTFSIPFTF